MDNNETTNQAPNTVSDPTTSQEESGYEKLIKYLAEMKSMINKIQEKQDQQNSKEENINKEEKKNVKIIY